MDEKAQKKLESANRLTGSDTKVAETEGHRVTIGEYCAEVKRHALKNPVVKALYDGWNSWGDILSGRVFDKSASVSPRDINITKSQAGQKDCVQYFLQKEREP